jgi:3-dehydroquinate synthase
MKILWRKDWSWSWIPNKAPFLLICDDIFKGSPFLSNCPANISTYFVKSGESLKDVQHWAEHLLKIQDCIKDQKINGVIAMGGGSVGDFAGFFASVYKRGVDLYQCPTTWLAAIDSAHGGKTALNVGNHKNQIGSFKQAKIIFICKKIILEQKQELLLDGLSELFKISLIEGGSLWKKANILADQLIAPRNVKNSSPPWSLDTHLVAEMTWDLLKPAVAGKYKIVKRDPFEKKGIRQLLNLGHTMGHVFELHCRISHGMAVSYGLNFAIEYSFHKKILKKSDYEKIRLSPIGLLLRDAGQDNLWKRLTPKQIEQSLFSDKKRTATTHKNLNFIFIQSVGKVRRLPVGMSEILKEVTVQSQLPRRS